MVKLDIKQHLHLIAFLVLGGMIVASSLFLMSNVKILATFIFAYAIISFTYLLYRYFFAIINHPIHHFNHLKKDRWPSVSILLPCYNEEKKYLIECIEHACMAKYPNKEIIIVDDGSKNKESWETILELQKKYHFRAFKFEENKGKRKAMAFGFREATGEIIIAMDSDTVISSGNSIKKLVEPFKNKNVGAVSGCVMVHNRKKNIMTRIQDARYWLAFHLEKSSQNPYDSVTCASGPFSAYRREYLMKFINEWEHQVFLGQECTYGDDRGLTTFMLKYGYDVKFSREAIAYTNVPETLKVFVKQQIRWKKSFIRENWYLSAFILNRNPFMIAEFVLFWAVFLMGFIAKFITLIFVFIGIVAFWRFIIMVGFVAIMHYLYVFLRSPGSRGYYGIVYGFLNEFLISWLFFPALLNLRDTNWGTR